MGRISRSMRLSTDLRPLRTRRSDISTMTSATVTATTQMTRTATASGFIGRAVWQAAVGKSTCSLTFPPLAPYTSGAAIDRPYHQQEVSTRCPSRTASPSSDRRNQAAELGGGAERIERQHRAGKKTARERLELLLDKGSFAEMDKLVVHQGQDFGMDAQRIPGDGVVVGSGRMHGRPVFVFAQDFTVFGGLALRGVRPEDLQDHGPRPEGGRADHRAQRLGRRPHPGGRGLPGRLRRHLPPQHAGLRRGAADLRHHGAVRGRRRLLAGHHRLRLHGEGAPPTCS